MNLKETLIELEILGTTQNRKVYARHGVKPPLYGVSYANIKKLTIKIKTNQTLSEELWQTINHDARVLATYIANPTEITQQVLEKWVKDLNSYVLTDAFCAMVSKSDLHKSLMKKWMTNEGEWIGRSGWSILSHNATTYALTEKTKNFFEQCLQEIEQTIHQRKNRVRDAMNSALISIASYNDYFKKKAIDAAKRIGKVEVDHGETSCKTPDAISYIEKIYARKN